MNRKRAILVALIVIIAGGLGAIGWFFAFGNRDSSTPEQNPQDKIPAIQLNIPEASLKNASSSRKLKVAINTSNYSAIQRVEYLVDEQMVETSRTAPFTVEISLADLSKGKHTLQAIAYDKSSNTSKSEVFSFTLEDNTTVEPSDAKSEAIVRQSLAFSQLGLRGGRAKTASSQNGSNNGGSQNPGGGDSGNNGPVTPLTPPAQICGNTTILNGGPTSAPTNAVAVAAGNNSGVNFNLANTTYWFAPGVHYIGSGEFSQIKPGNNSTFVGAPGAVIDGQGINKYAFSEHGTNVTIKYLTVQNFVAPKNEGVINHDSGVGWTMEYITAQDNGGGAIFLGSNNVARYNCMKDNGQYGFQVYSSDPGGPQNVLLDHNEIVGNNTDNWEALDPGCGCTGGGKFWDAHTVTITNNYVHDNHSVGLWADTNDTDFLVESNYISDNEGQGLFYEISYNMIVRNNNFIRNAVTGGPDNTSFPTAAIYLSEAGGDNRVPGRTANIDIYDNIFTDNWAGVVLWENADRFCSSPANTSTGTCTLVNPAATLATCTDPANGGLVNVQPYYSDCRWKTQNVKVHNNVFALNKANIPSCSTTASCGLQGIFSNSGSSPSWSPYMGTVIQNDITFNQNNLFSNNTYTGDWNFMIKAQNKTANFAVWQLSPYSQDVGSTFNGQSSYHVANTFDADTSTLEGSIGKWSAWYSDTIARTTEQAHTGTNSLKINITAPFGWGVQLTTSGYAITPKPKNVSFWGRLGTGTNLNATLRIQWLNDSLSQVGSFEDITISSLDNTWKQSSRQIVPPAGATIANVRIINSTGTTGNSMYLDDFVMEDVQ